MKNIMVVGPDAFSSCIALEELTLPDSVQTLFRYTCQGCDKLTDFKALGAIRIENGVFDGCYLLKNIMIKSEIADKLSGELWHKAVDTFLRKESEYPDDVADEWWNYVGLHKSDVLKGLLILESAESISRLVSKLPLTKKEQKVFWELARKIGNTEIAHILGMDEAISKSTNTELLRDCFDKLPANKCNEKKKSKLLSIVALLGTDNDLLEFIAKYGIPDDLTYTLALLARTGEKEKLKILSDNGATIEYIRDSKGDTKHFKLIEAITGVNICYPEIHVYYKNYMLSLLEEFDLFMIDRPVDICNEINEKDACDMIEFMDSIFPGVKDDAIACILESFHPESEFIVDELKKRGVYLCYEYIAALTNMEDKSRRRYLLNRFHLSEDYIRAYFEEIAKMNGAELCLKL